MKIGICIICYNRLYALERLLNSLNNAYYNDDRITLIISIDKSDTAAVEEYARHFDWRYGDKRVIAHSENLGLRKHILQCGDFLEEFDALIVLEDDIYVAPAFYQYAIECVIKYQHDERIAGISLYGFSMNYQNQYPFTPLRYEKHDAYFMNCAQSWGQVWMRKQWGAFKQWYEHHSDEFGLLSHLPRTLCSWSNTSWLKFHTRYCIEQDKYFVYPYVALSTNFGDAGANNTTGYESIYQVNLQYGSCPDFRLPDLNNDSVRYDSFFEFKGYSVLCKQLGITESDLCVDFYGEKHDVLQYRYWLTRERAGYQVVASYGLRMKPYELNIFFQIDGTDLYVYDRSHPCNATCVDSEAYRKFLVYCYQITWTNYMKKIIKNSRYRELVNRLYKLLK